MVPVGIALQRLCMRAVIVPPPVLVAGVLALSTLGAYAGSLSLAEAAHALAFGVVGCLMQRFGFPIPAAVLGMVLGFTMEGEVPSLAHDVVRQPADLPEPSHRRRARGPDGRRPAEAAPGAPVGRPGGGGRGPAPARRDRALVVNPRGRLLT